MNSFEYIEEYYKWHGIALFDCSSRRQLKEYRDYF